MFLRIVGEYGPWRTRLRTFLGMVNKYELCIFRLSFRMNQSEVLIEVNTTSFENATTYENTTLSESTGQTVELGNIKQIMFTIQYALLPFFFLTGLFGNTMTIITMASRHFQHLTSRYILIALAISDTVLLLTQPFNKLFVIDFFGRDLRALSDFFCKAFFVVFKSSKMTSSWLVVLLCFERFIAVVYPLKAKFILRKRFILPAIALDYGILLIYNSVWSFASEIVDGVCKPDVPSLQQKIFVAIGTCLYSFIPTLLLMILTPLIVLRLLRQRRRRRNLASKVSSQASKNEEEMLKASVMVIGIMIAYIILIIPISVVHFYSWTASISAFDVNNLSFFIFREIAQVLEQVNYSINFFLYVMCSTMFRRRVFEILKCGRRSNKLTRSQSSMKSSFKQTSSANTDLTNGVSQSLD